MTALDISRAVWRKSSHSGGNGDCVEVAANWRKSSHSGGNGGCVEVADNLAEVVAVRDSKDPRGPVLTVARAEWEAFTTGVKRGEFDLS